MKEPQDHIAPPPDCTGCALCANVCPKDAIRMVWSGEGFSVPAVDEEACIRCGLCVRKCIAGGGKYAEYDDDLARVRAFGAWNADVSLHRESSSGGVFSAMAEEIFRRGGCVYGVVWQDKETAVFRKAESMAETRPMRGSKYTQALPGYAYRDIRRELRRRPVLFVGTPCQVNALKSGLEGSPANLLTVDIACHGVPSRLALQAYIRCAERETGRVVERVDFRDNVEGWLNYHVTIHYTDGTSSSCRSSADPFMALFLSDAALNRSCLNCPFKHFPRQGDFSVGDYWGAQELHPEWSLEEGVSSLFVNTEKGGEFLKSLGGSLCLQPEKASDIYRGQKNTYIARSSLNPNRAATLAALRRKDITMDEALDCAERLCLAGPFTLKSSSMAARILKGIGRLRNSLAWRMRAMSRKCASLFTRPEDS